MDLLASALGAIAVLVVGTIWRRRKLKGAQVNAQATG
jgi:hypothetical protein